MENNCPFCNSTAIPYPNYKNNTIVWECPSCGRFKLSANSAPSIFLKPDVKDMVATYLFYNGIHKKEDELLTVESRYIWLDDETKKMDDDQLYQIVTINQIKAFYNVNFAKKISLILLDIAKRTSFFGEKVDYSYYQLLSLAFCKRWDDNNGLYDERILIK